MGRTWAVHMGHTCTRARTRIPTGCEPHCTLLPHHRATHRALAWPSCAPLSAHLSLHHRTAAPPFRACRTRLTLSRPLLANPDPNPNPNPNPNPDPNPSPNPNQAKAGWLAGHDPDEESSLDLLPPEWRWQSGGAQHGAGTGAVRAAPLQRPPATHSDCQLTANSSPSPLRPMRPAPSNPGGPAPLQRLAPHYHPPNPRARHTKRTRPKRSVPLLPPSGASALLQQPLAAARRPAPGARLRPLHQEALPTRGGDARLGVPPLPLRGA